MNISKYIFPLFVFAGLSYTTPICGKDGFSILESGQAQFDNDVMVLEGPVALENEWGKIHAKKATLDVTNKKGKFQFHHAVLEGNVLISIVGEGQLQCQRAEFDTEKGIATFKVPEGTEEFVVYSAIHSEGESATAPFVVKSKQLNMSLGKKEQSSGETGKSCVQRVEAKDDVSINFGSQFTAKCEHASYSDNNIVLNNNVEVDFGAYGVFKTSDEVQLKRDDTGGIETIKCLGNSEYCCEDEENNIDLVLLCSGIIFVDHIKRKMYFQSEKNSQGIVDDEKQVFFRDHLGKVHSDKALILYDFEKGIFSLKTIYLDGSVRLINRGGSILQYALSEQVTYEHATQQMYFKSPKNKRVLFYDKINNLQVSAPEIRMLRDKQTKKQQFQGVGDVRFHFAEKEYQQLRKRFLLEKKSL